MQNAYRKTNLKSRDFQFIHKIENPIRCDHLSDWLQNAVAIVAKKMDIKLDPANYAAHISGSGGCTDLPRHGVPSQGSIN